MSLDVRERQLDAQDPVLIGRTRLLGDDVGPERDRAAKRPMLDLELLVDATLDVGLATVAGERQLAALDLEPEVPGVDAGELGVDDRARRVVGVEDVDRRREAGAACRPPPPAGGGAREKALPLPAPTLRGCGEGAVAGPSRQVPPRRCPIPCRS